MFSRDPMHYRATPRTLQTSKFGPYASIDRDDTRSRAGSVLYLVAAILCAATLGILLGFNG
jgi:hypothetical protein